MLENLQEQSQQPKDGETQGELGRGIALICPLVANRTGPSQYDSGSAGAAHVLLSTVSPSMPGGVLEVLGSVNPGLLGRGFLTGFSPCTLPVGSTSPQPGPQFQGPRPVADPSLQARSAARKLWCCLSLDSWGKCGYQGVWGSKRNK
jgi:hypothetical protein